MKLGDWIQIVGMVSIAVGVALFSVPVGIIFAGIAMLAVGVSLKIGE
jgi:uncharacterized membrane-anchored protein YitT (DUF2179 family)